MIHSFPATPERDRRAVALVIVLAFVVLLAGLIIAFFSTAMLDRQISNSSASAIKVDLLAQGAIETLTGDFKQEITAGSNATLYTDSNQSGKSVGSTYLPVNPADAVPALALQGQSGVTSFAPNLVKRSAYQQNFFPATGDPGAAYYNAGNTSQTVPLPASSSLPSPASAPVHAPSKRAANAASTTPSQNGRYISLARWNKPLLLPKKNQASTNDTDMTPVTSGANAFVAPDWVLVARDGSNPTAWNSNLATSAANTTSVIGRYAYAVYDEGGLLDMNAAGYPTDAAGKNDPRVAYKAGLPFADLTQIPGISALPLARQQSVINAVVGWRNYASAQLSGGSLASGFVFSGAPLTNFTTAMWGNTTGFLKTANAALVSSQSDRMFTSRQELMNLLIQGIPQSGSAGQSDRANLQNALPYLGTFGRTVNQPSFVPATFSDPANAPKVLAPASGGNNANGLDQRINPSFLNVRAQGTFTRNDGTPATVGDPLVRKRLALNDLAWLTFKGPLSDGLNASPTTVNADATIQSLAQQLHDTYGLSWGFLQQGTAGNVKNYFGLEWKVDSADGQTKWFYDYHNDGAAPATGSKGAIMKLGDIAALRAGAHEPDFFELLKAAVNVGAIGKSASTSATGTSSQQWQFNRDVDVDAQIIQTGANIIDQYDLDGYPTRIVFDNGNGAQEFRGVENLPYLYRVRYTYFKARMSVPDSSNYYGGMISASASYYVASSGDSSDAYDWATNMGGTIIQQPNATGTGPGTGNPPPLTNTGLVLNMVIPDVWNPHDQNASRGALDSSGNPLFPTSFRVVAQSAPPGGSPLAFTTTLSRGGSTRSFLATNPVLDTSLAFTLYTDASNGWGTHSRKVTTSNSGLYFTIPQGTNGLFHEPTALFKVGVPAGSQLSGLDPTSNGEDNALIHPRKPSDPAPFTNDDGNLNLFASGPGATDGLLEDPNLASGFGYKTAKEPLAGQKYLGFYLGGGPLACRVIDTGTTNRTWQTDRQFSSGAPATGLTYQMQCLLNGKWVTYDEKYSDFAIGNMYNQWVQDGSSFPYASMPGNGHDSNGYAHWLDPRTSRFGALTSPAYPINYSRTSPTCLAPPGGTTWPLGVTTGVLDQVNWVLAPDRPDFEGGRIGGWPGGAFFSTAAGWYSNSGNFQPELFSQNRPDVFSDGRAVSTDTASSPSPLRSQYYTDPDGVVRRAMGAYALPSSTRPATLTSLPSGGSEVIGVPQVMGGAVSNGTSTPNDQSQSQPLVLNRPFRSVSELGYTFSGTPWKNLDFFTPESGYSALLDVFSINDTDDPNGLLAGKVNLNTRQAPVLQAVLNGGYKDETAAFSPQPASTPLPALTTTDAQNVAAALVLRTTMGATTKSNTISTPLGNIAAVVGQWSAKTSLPGFASNGAQTGAASPNNIDGNASYDGLSKDLGAIPFSANATQTTGIQRFRETAIRPLASIGQTRVWNMMIDLVAQTGRYPANTATLDKFIVEGEQRYWVHLSIDRLTGQIIDKQIEVVKE